MATLYITPDLGWASVDNMLNPALNALAVEADEVLVTPTDDVFTGFVGPLYPVLQLSTGNVTIDANAIRGLLGDGLKHYYRLGATGNVRTFVLQLGTAGVE